MLDNIRFHKIQKAKSINNSNFKVHNTHEGFVVITNNCSFLLTNDETINPTKYIDTLFKYKPQYIKLPNNMSVSINNNGYYIFRTLMFNELHSEFYIGFYTK